VTNHKRFTRNPVYCVNRARFISWTTWYRINHTSAPSFHFIFERTCVEHVWNESQELRGESWGEVKEGAASASGRSAHLRHPSFVASGRSGVPPKNRNPARSSRAAHVASGSACWLPTPAESLRPIGTVLPVIVQSIPLWNNPNNCARLIYHPTYTRLIWCFFAPLSHNKKKTILDLISFFLFPARNSQNNIASSQLLNNNNLIAPARQDSDSGALIIGVVPYQKLIYFKAAFGEVRRPNDSISRCAARKPAPSNGFHIQLEK